MLSKSPVLPVLMINDISHALPLARALLEGGLPVLEITLRTACAMQAIKLITNELPEAIVGVGTVTRPEQFEEARNAGAQFAVSPGLTPALIRASRAIDMPFLPGVFTPSEAMIARDEGFNTLKLFPAEQAGGIGMLKAIGSPVPELKFCPTGGIGPSSLQQYLKLPNVICVGGSWVSPAQAMQSGNWKQITKLAAEAVAAAANIAGSN
ncbi:MAG: bifunctional 4-hydroxy-2-oxoglutarate aldolase/2-dehydro-3-deoxy-phosphogluconate aldolase [Chloroflexi bacterium]|nr:bifunctional 4-hydroxy-2-oxoglutarate aldolase/2-dehydro-3-deoxy-phosphogluconate aldolase [Chloroflexota bacterium]